MGWLIVMVAFNPKPCYLRNNKTAFFCGKCNEEENNSYDIINIPPKILVLILDRGKEKKSTAEVKFQIDLDLDHLIFYLIILILSDKRIIDKDDNNNIFNTKYKLIGLSNHSGDISSSGNYTAYCLADDGFYYYFSDTFVDKVNEKLYNKKSLIYYLISKLTNIFYKLEDYSNKFN